MRNLFAVWVAACTAVKQHVHLFDMKIYTLNFSCFFSLLPNLLLWMSEVSFQLKYIVVIHQDSQKPLFRICFLICAQKKNEAVFWDWVFTLWEVWWSKLFMLTKLLEYVLRGDANNWFTSVRHARFTRWRLLRTSNKTSLLLWQPVRIQNFKGAFSNFWLFADADGALN